MHIFNKNWAKVFKKFKHFKNYVAIVKHNSCYFKVLQLGSLFTHVIGFRYIKRNELIRCQGFSLDSTTKKKFNLKLFGTCNFGGMVEA
jgi:hypothetical protein